MIDLRCLALAAALLAGAAAARAQKAITLYGGARAGSGFEQATTPPAAADLRSGGALSLGIDWPYDATRQFQLLLSHQRTRLELAPPPTPTPGAPSEMPLRISYVHLGGLNYFQGQLSQGPYVAGGLGLTYLSPSLQGTSSRVRGSMNVGLGYHLPLSKTLALRTELRGYFTVINSSGSFFCSGGCVVQIKGDLLTQVEAMAGLTLVF